MKLDIIWSNNDYDNFIKYLYSIQDVWYKQYHSKLILKKSLIGIRTPLLKKIAKQISKGDIDSFIKYNKHELYEEVLIHGLIIGHIKDFNLMTKYLNKFYQYIDNWSINDVTCCNLKIFKKHQEKGFKYILTLIKNKDPWKIRVGLVLLLTYYINDNYITKLFDIAVSIENDEYYVKLANAWLVANCYIKYPEITLEFIKSNRLNKWTHNRAIQKLRDAEKIPKSIKDELELLKIK
ncbi:MAG: DNA alkylation repair protein [Bacilli bacterium]